MRMFCILRANGKIFENTGWLLECKKAVFMFNRNSIVVIEPCHKCDLQMDFDNVKVVGHEPQYQRPILEA